MLYTANRMSFLWVSGGLLLKRNIVFTLILLCFSACDAGSPEEYVVDCDGGMCRVPEGPFWMGCNESLDDECLSNEFPGREVTVDAFYMDVHEVTRSAYLSCVDAEACTVSSCEWDPADTEDLPAVCVDWFQASAYCAWAGKRLPTEAEWEKAARGVDGRKYPWGQAEPSCDLAAMPGCTRKVVAPCGHSPAGDSPYGLCDMAGNAWEWTSDRYDENYYGVAPSTNPRGPETGTSRVRRGGSFQGGGYDPARVSLRGSLEPSSSGYENVGFRCAASRSN